MGGPAPVVISSPRRLQQCADGAKWKGITMFGIMLIVLAAVITYKAAEMSERSGGLWAAICVLITLVLGLLPAVRLRCRPVWELADHARL